jgi:hypothetical protein
VAALGEVCVLLAAMAVLPAVLVLARSAVARLCANEAGSPTRATGCRKKFT